VPVRIGEEVQAVLWRGDGEPNAPWLLLLLGVSRPSKRDKFGVSGRAPPSQFGTLATPDSAPVKTVSLR
jgi:hypothetical protein